LEREALQSWRAQWTHAAFSAASTIGLLAGTLSRRSANGDRSGPFPRERCHDVQVDTL